MTTLYLIGRGWQVAENFISDRSSQPMKLRHSVFSISVLICLYRQYYVEQLVENVRLRLNWLEIWYSTVSTSSRLQRYIIEIVSGEK